MHPFLYRNLILSLDQRFLCSFPLLLHVRMEGWQQLGAAILHFSFDLSQMMLWGGHQRRKNLGSRVALLPGKFLRVRKVFARITEKYLVNCPNTFKTTQIFPDDCQFSGLFQNCPDFSRWQPIFRIISKLSGFFQMTANFPDDFKTVRMFQVTANFPDDFKTVQIFPDDCQFSR